MGCSNGCSPLCPAEESLSWLLEEPEDAAEFFEAVADYKIALIEKLFREWALLTC